MIKQPRSNPQEQKHANKSKSMLFPNPPKKPCPQGNDVCHCNPKLLKGKY